MLLEINFTMVIFAASFLMFIYLLNLTLYKPVGKVIEDRKSLITSDYSKAKGLSDDASQLLGNYKKQIQLARLDAHNIVQEFIDKAQKDKERKIAVLVSSLNKEKEEELEKLQIEQREIMKQLETKLKTLSDLITTKILGSEEKTLVSSH